MERLSKLQKSILTVLKIVDETEFIMDKAKYRCTKNRQRLLLERDDTQSPEPPPFWYSLKDSFEEGDFFKEGIKTLVQKRLGLADSKAFDASFSRSIKSLMKKGYIERSYSTKKIERSDRWKPNKHQTDFIKLTEKGINVNL